MPGGHSHSSSTEETLLQLFPLLERSWALLSCFPRRFARKRLFWDEDGIRWKVNWRRHRVDVKIKISNALKPLTCFQAATWKMKLEVLVVCKVPELYIDIVDKFTLKISILILSQGKFMYLCFESPCLLAHILRCNTFSSTAEIAESCANTLLV